VSWNRKDVLHFSALIAACAAVTAVLIVLQTCLRRSGGGDAAGTIVDGSTVIVLDHLGHDKERETRVTTIDATTGKHTVRHERGHLDAIDGRRVVKTCNVLSLPVNPEATGTPLREAKVLRDTATGREIEGVVLHEPHKLSGVDAAGAVLWTVDLGKPCEAATVVDGVLAITTLSSTYRARSIDLATGEIRWTIGF
jgi:hypothetical protein